MERPTLVTAIAILFFVFGGLGLVCFGGGFLYTATRIDEAMFNALPGPAGTEYTKTKEKTEQLMQEKVPFYQIVSNGLTVLTFLLCGLMIVAGIGLWRMQPWGRALALVYAPLSLLSTIFGTVYNFLFIVPIQGEMFEGMAGPQQQQMAQMQSAMAAGTGVLGALLMSIFPLFVLICMLIPSMKAAFSKDQGQTRAFEDNP